jgi:hypothetical protein
MLSVQEFYAQSIRSESRSESLEESAEIARAMSTPLWVYLEWRRLWASEGESVATAYLDAAPMIDEDGDEYYPKHR